jgi:hypothetical protein
MCLPMGPSATGAGLSDAVETVGLGTVNWTTGVVTATGLGAPPGNAVNLAQARAMAERAAYSVAVRNLLEVVKGIQVDSVSIVESSMVKSDAVRTRVSGLVKGAQKIKTEDQPDGAVEVTVVISLSGELLDAVIPKEFGRHGTTAVLAPKAPVAPPPAPLAVPKVEPPAPSSTPPPAPAPAPTPPTAQLEPAPSPGSGQVPSAEVYTGLLVDARGLGLRPALAPRLLDENGKELYAGDILARDQAVQAGVAGYAKDIIAGSRQARVTDKPLIVKGVRASGNKATDIVLDGEGVKAIQQSEPSARYLQQARVVVVYD